MALHTSSVAILVGLIGLSGTLAVRRDLNVDLSANGEVNVDDVAGSVVAEGETHADAVLELGAGHLLRGRYRLDEFLHTHNAHDSESSKGTVTASASQQATPGESFPTIYRRQLAPSKHLGQGSFGDVWKAFDTHLNKDVAVKIFFSKDENERPFYLSEPNARRLGLSEKLEENKIECSLVINMLKNAQAYPQGAARICQCYQEHVSDGVGQNVPVFLVQELCGTELTHIYQQSNFNPVKARWIVRQLLEGIAFLNMFDPPLTHHDLKPGNLCVMRNGDVKLIDFGAMRQATPTNSMLPATATAAFMAPETATGRLSFYVSPRNGAGHSFDVYAAGLIYMLLICPQINYHVWYADSHTGRLAGTVQQHMANVMGMGVQNVAADLQIIQGLLATNAEHRLTPMQALQAGNDNGLFVPPEAGQRLTRPFAVGTQVDFWNTLTGQWVTAVITQANQAAGLYQLVWDTMTPTGPVRATADNVDPAYIRQKVTSRNAAAGMVGMQFAPVQAAQAVAQGTVRNPLMQQMVMHPNQEQGNPAGEVQALEISNAWVERRANGLYVAAQVTLLADGWKDVIVVLECKRPDNGQMDNLQIPGQAAERFLHVEAMLPRNDWRCQVRPGNCRLRSYALATIDRGAHWTDTGSASKFFVLPCN